MRVGLFITCLGDTLFPETGRATVEVLERLGHTVVFPAGQTCCGQMQYNTGYPAEAALPAAKFARDFAGYDAVVVPSGSCGAFIRDVHPKLVPEAVKLTAVKLLKEYAIGPEPAPQSYRAAAEIVGYCMVGSEAFANANDELLTQRVENQIETALDAGDSLDAKLVLLTLHAKVIQPSVVERFGLEAATRG